MLDAKSACENALMNAAEAMCMAAITAPKACGKDSVACAILTGEEIAALAKEMRRIEDETEGCRPIFYRDAAQVEQCPAVVLIGSVNQARGVGVAVGSAVGVAADRRVDNRVFYTAGIAAMNLKLLGEKVGTILAIPISATNRNIFFFGR